jgi:hypothetical protein
MLAFKFVNIPSRVVCVSMLVIVRNLSKGEDLFLFGSEHRYLAMVVYRWNECKVPRHCQS